MSAEQCGFWFGVGFGLPIGAAILTAGLRFEAAVWGRR